MKQLIQFGALAAAVVVLACQHPAAAQTPSLSAGPVDSAIIDDLVAANRILANQGVLDAFGHVSIRHPNDPNRYLMSQSRAPMLVSADDIMEYDLDSNPVEQRGRSMVAERFIHGQIYKGRPDVNAVIHSHSPTVVPFSVTQVLLKPIAHTAGFLYGGVPVFDIRKEDLSSSGLLVTNNKLGGSLAATLGDRPVALMRGHGNVVVGPNVQRAVLRAIYTEVNARLLAIAISLGGPIKYISAEEVYEGDLGIARAWEVLKHSTMGK